MDYQPPFQMTDRIQDLCLEVAEKVGALQPARGFSGNVTLHRELRISTIHSSLVIEGNVLSRDAVTAILDGKRVAGPQADVREVQNAQRAYDLMDVLDPYDVGDLLRAHAVLMDGLVSDAGRLRSRNAGVYDGDTMIHAGSPHNYVAGLVRDLFSWAQTTGLHPLVSSSVFHYEFEFIHPFSDGNGRSGRLWHTLLLSRWREAFKWIPVESAIRSRQQEYYQAFVSSSGIGSATPFVEFMLSCTSDVLDRLLDNPTKRGIVDSRILDYLKRQPHATVAMLCEHMGMSRRTLEREFARLKAEKRIVRHGSRRAGHWEVL